MISYREIIILKELRGQEEYVNSTYIAEKLAVSSRTVKRDIKNLIEVLNQNGANIEATNKGYKIIIEDKEKYKNFSGKYLNDKEVESNGKEKIRKIIALLVTHEYINQDAIVAKLYLSRSTLNKLINEVKNELGEYSIQLNNKPHYGYFIEGNELDIRNCMVKYLVGVINEDEFVISDELAEYDKKRCGKLYKDIIEIFKEERLIKTDIEVDYLVKYIIVSAFRCKSDYSISFDGILNFSLENRIIAVAERISKVTMDTFGVNLKLEDIFYIAYLIGNSYEESKKIQDNKSYFNESVKNCLKEIKRVYNIDFFKDEKLILGLENHLYTSCFRYCLNASLNNPLIAKIKSKYAQAYDYSILCSEILKKEYNMKLSEEDIGYIALHFAASLERDIMNNNIKVIIVCSSGVGTAELIKSRIMKNMPNVSVIGVYPEYMLDVLDLSGVDLIISTVETINFNIDKEIVNVSPLLLREDIVKLNEHISRQREYDYLETLMIDKLFFLDISAENKEEAIECMCQRLIGNEIISQETAEAIKNREKISSTEINDLVAIPHCIAGTGKKSVIAVGILEKPILWDKTFVQLVFLGSLDPNIAENRHVFTMLYKLTKKKEKVKELIKLKNLSEFKRKLFVK